MNRILMNISRSCSRVIFLLWLVRRRLWEVRMGKVRQDFKGTKKTRNFLPKNKMLKKFSNVQKGRIISDIFN